MTVKGIYKNGVIHLLDKTDLKEDQEVIINTIPSFEEFKAKLTGDYLRYNDETLKAIYDSEFGIDLTECKDIDEFKKKLFDDED